MKRLVGWLGAAAVAFVGCNGSGARGVLDPFSRTTVEPPRTGCIMGQPADPYYSDTRQAALPGRGTTQSGSWKSSQATDSDTTTVPVTTKPRTSSRTDASQRDYEEQGAVAEERRTRPATGPGDRLIIPLAARTPVDSPRPGQDTIESDLATVRQAAAGAETVLASRGPVVRTILPGPPKRPDARLATQRPDSLGGEPCRFTPSGRTINLMDLPDAGSTRGAGSAATGARGEVRLVSATEPVGGASAGTPVNRSRQTTELGGSFSPRAQFGHDPDYRWLRGRLEYSEIDRKWKLRYIPIDGTTDEFGGSVVVPDASVLSGYERGQFVEVRGTLGPVPEDEDRGYAPEYHVDGLERLGT